MKIKNLFFTALASTALFVGCEEKNPDLGAPSITVDPASLEFSQAGGASEAKTVSILATRDWKVESKPEWITVSPESGSASADAQAVTITVTANESVDRTGSVKFVAGPADAKLSVVQPGAKGGSTPIADFLKAAVGDEWYTLTGKITNLQTGNYGNFDLVDETGTVYVYGLTAEKREDGKNDQSFPTLGLKDGDIVTLCGKRAEFKGEPQVGGPAYYISHVAGVIDYVDMASIEEVFTTNEKYVSVKGSVVAAGKVSYIINDGGDKNLYIYTDSEPEVKVGDVVRVKGTRTEYPDYVNSGVTIETKLVQLTAPSAEKISETITPKAETALELSDAELAKFCPAYSQLIKFTATVVVDGKYTNLDLGAGGTGNVVSSSFDDQITDGKRLDFTGYYGGRNARGYLNILPTAVAESAAPYINVNPTTLDFAVDGETKSFTVESNVEWTAVSSDETNFPVTVSGNTVSVTATANTGDARTATVSVKAKNDESVVATVNLTQVKNMGDGVTTVTKSILDISGTTTNGTKVQSMSLDDVITMTASDGNNTGKVYGTGTEWRFYQTDNATLTISAKEGHELVYVKITYGNSNSGVLLKGGVSLDSDKVDEVSGSSVVYSVGQSVATDKNNGRVDIKTVEVAYK